MDDGLADGGEWAKGWLCRLARGTVSRDSDMSKFLCTLSTCVGKCRGETTMRSKISLLNTLWQASRARDTTVHALRWRHGIIIVLPVWQLRCGGLVRPEYRPCPGAAGLAWET